MFKGLFDRFHGQFKSRVRASYMIVFVGIVYATISLEG